LRIGYPRAARLLDQLEEMGVVGPSLGGGKERDVMLGPMDDEESNSDK
jgi:S-DNA-T family DNA segregation ATPase FtsK/SpoIIIE